MKSVKLTALVAAFALLTAVQNSFAEEKDSADKAPAAVKKDAPVFKTDQEKVSYIIGTQIGGSFKAQGLDITLDLLIRGIRDAAAGIDSAIPQEEQQKVMDAFRKQQMEKMQAKRAEMEEKQKTEATEKMGEENAWKLNLKKPELMTVDSAKDYFWMLDTNKGKIKVKLMPDVAPMHVTSTIFLTKKGFYNDLLFHRVIPGFMAQGGCPLGTGTGGPGYKYDGEISDSVKHDKPYLLSMANAGEGTDGSQFFLTFKKTPWLDGKHTIFGEIVEGQDVMEILEAAGSRSGKPSEILKINKATIEEKAK